MLSQATKVMVICYSSRWKVVRLVTGPVLIVLHILLLNFDQSFICKDDKILLREVS